MPILERIRETKQQARLNKKERHENLKEAFQLNTKIVQDFTYTWGPNIRYWGERIKGVRENFKRENGKKKPLYFLVDDVCTTGSTLENCAEVLKRNGFDKVYGLVVARAFK